MYAFIFLAGYHSDFQRTIASVNSAISDSRTGNTHNWRRTGQQNVMFIWQLDSPATILGTNRLDEFLVWNVHVKERALLSSQYNLALINRAGGLYGRILTEVVSTDRTQ